MDISWAIAGLMAIVNGLLFYILKKQADRLDCLEKDMAAMRLNYINRFELATADRTDMKAELLEAINKMNVENIKQHQDILFSLQKEKHGD